MDVPTVLVLVGFIIVSLVYQWRHNRELKLQLLAIRAKMEAHEVIMEAILFKQKKDNESKPNLDCQQPQ